MVNFDLKDGLNILGDRSYEIATKIFDKVSGEFGMESSTMSIKLLTIIILLGGLYGVLKITNKGIKIILLILIPLLIVSIVYSMFQAGV